MDRFDFGSFDSSNNDIAFSSDRGYADPSSELETRKQLSYPLKELRDFVNDTVATDTDGNVVQIVVSDGSIGYKETPDGDPTSVEFLPSGGTKDQVLAKNSGTDYDIGWKDVDTIAMTTIYTSTGPSGFAGLTLTGLPQYKLLVILMRYQGGGSSITYSNCFPMVSGDRYAHADDYCRKVSMSEGGGTWTLSITDCYHNRSSVTDDSHCVPVRIYGYR